MHNNGHNNALQTYAVWSALLWPIMHCGPLCRQLASCSTRFWHTTTWPTSRRGYAPVTFICDTTQPSSQQTRKRNRITMQCNPAFIIKYNEAIITQELKRAPRLARLHNTDIRHDYSASNSCRQRAGYAACSVKVMGVSVSSDCLESA